MLMRIRTAMSQRDKTHQLNGTIEFDETYFGGPAVGKKRGRDTEKAKVFVAVSLDRVYWKSHIWWKFAEYIQKYGVTYMHMLNKSKIRLHLLNVFGKEIFRPCTLSRDTQRQRDPQIHGFSAITLHFGSIGEFKKQEFPNLYIYKQCQ